MTNYGRFWVKNELHWVKAAYEGNSCDDPSGGGPYNFTLNAALSRLHFYFVPAFANEFATRSQNKNATCGGIQNKVVELEGFEPSSGVGKDNAFYMFSCNYCRALNGLPHTISKPYVAL